ncbi:MAG: hypothetical protein HRT69_05070 [Flavobacteriaceae bacterium]|nr:hypothetical protein [Flavobacteriaceae bacterium]
MKLKYRSLIILITILVINLKGYSQEEIITTTEQIEIVENHLLYNTNWKLVKMEPAFSDKIDLTLNFDKATEQLKVIKQITSAPVLKGTDLITTKNESINFYHWKYAIKSAEYEGDNVKSVIYDYAAFELKTEGYVFEIDSLSETSLVLKVVKAPMAVFGNSIFNVDKIYFTK